MGNDTTERIKLQVAEDDAAAFEYSRTKMRKGSRPYLMQETTSRAYWAEVQMARADLEEDMVASLEMLR